VAHKVYCIAKGAADYKCRRAAITGLSLFLSSAVNFGVMLLRSVNIAIARRLAVEMPLKEIFLSRFDMYTVSEKDCTLFYFFLFIFFLGAQCVESGVSCTDCY